tara:strand:- start:350 stop:1786 length:1437 start_codon:yes stop_codon:yes gene_type:complete
MTNTSTIKILQGDCLETLKQLEKNSINTCITSPPYWGLRDYNGEEKQLGLEETPEEFVQNLVNVFKEVKRVLRDDGTVWLNLGDSYAGNSSRASDNGRAGYGNKREGVFSKTGIGLKNKDLVGIPWRVAFALQQDGWYLRQDIIWHKPNPMPESVTDRCTKAHEYIFLLSKSSKYYFDNEAIKEKAVGERWGGDSPINLDKTKDTDNQFSGLTRNRKMIYENKNKRSVWTVATKPFKGSHFATFPMELIKPCLLAGCPEKVCKDCNEPYINTPIFEYDSNTKTTNRTHGKYNDEATEAANRQGLHSNRGDKLVEVRDNLPKQSALVDFLKLKTSAKKLAKNTDIPLSKLEHWFRYDNSGFAYPTIDDWNKVREFIDDFSNEFYKIDLGLTQTELKTDAMDSKKIIGHNLNKSCDCKNDETKGGVVLDPFGGSATTGILASGNNRNSVICELNKEYIEIAKERINTDLGMFANIEIKQD